MRDLFSKVFSGAIQGGTSMMSLMISFWFCPLWLVVFLTILPYLVALIVYVALWFMNERTEKMAREHELALLKSTQDHEIALLKAKKIPTTK